MTDMNEKRPKKEEVPQSWGVFGYSLPQTILMAVLAGFLYQAYSDRDQLEEFISRWVFGVEPVKPLSSSLLATIEFSGAKVIETDSIDVGSFHFSKPKAWLTVEAPDFRYLQLRHSGYQGLLNPTATTTIRNLPSFLKNPSKVYAISLPERSGEIFALNQHVHIMTPALAKAASEAVTVRKRDNSANTNSIIFRMNPKLMTLGEKDFEIIRSDDAFNIALSNQIYYLNGTKSETARPEINRFFRTRFGDYTIAEIDYTTDNGKRVSSIIYWHHKEGAPSGELGIFFANLKTNEKQGEAVRKLYSSLHIKQENETIWQNLNFDGLLDKKTMPFVRVDINYRQLRQFGLSATDIKKKIIQSLPVEVNELGEVELSPNKTNTVRLRDIANIERVFGEAHTLQDINSVMLFISRDR